MALSSSSATTDGTNTATRRPTSPRHDVANIDPSSSRSPSTQRSYHSRLHNLSALPPTVRTLTIPSQQSTSGETKRTLSHVEITNVRDFQSHPDWQQVRELYFRRKAKKALRDEWKGQRQHVGEHAETRFTSAQGLQGSWFHSTSYDTSENLELEDTPSAQQTPGHESSASLSLLEGDIDNQPHAHAHGAANTSTPNEHGQCAIAHRPVPRTRPKVTSTSTSEYEASSDSEQDSPLPFITRASSIRDDGSRGTRLFTTAIFTSTRRKPSNSKRTQTIYTLRKAQRVLREFTRKELDDLYDIDAEGWCHMCHKKKIVMRCNTHQEKMQKKRPSGGSFCDPCLAK